MYSGDCPQMAKEISKGILTEASFRAIAEAHPGDDSLAAKLSEHAAQVYFAPHFLEFFLSAWFSLCFSDLAFALLQLLGYAGFLRVRVARQTAFRTQVLGSLEKAKAMCSDLAIKNLELANSAEKEVSALREELKEKEKLSNDSSQKISDLGSQIAELISANEAYQKEKSEAEDRLTKALAEKAVLQAEVDALKKEPKKKKMKALKEEVAELKKDLEDLGVEKDKSDQMTKVGFQDGFCLVRHQVLQRFPDLDLSFLEALNIPEGPRWSWSKIEHLNLPSSLPAPKIVEKNAGAGGSQDAGNP